MFSASKNLLGKILFTVGALPSNKLDFSVIVDVTSSSKLTPYGEPPSPRAAHVATAVGPMFVYNGGLGPGGLSAEDLHVLYLTQQQPQWHSGCLLGRQPFLYNNAQNGLHIHWLERVQLKLQLLVSDDVLS
ncbi:hypothetical protein Bca52824_023882 [Brassica carinata]|uniref:Uncharacterized protein n=1 Tax=Brassica carinata TaxID=52824 RepID=A0A8X8ATR2_BRACI|nr:hypothetical protein Bca52824_023882 [Brassica carinata]